MKKISCRRHAELCLRARMQTSVIFEFYGSAPLNHSSVCNTVFVVALNASNTKSQRSIGSQATVDELYICMSIDPDATHIRGCAGSTFLKGVSWSEHQHRSIGWYTGMRQTRAYG